jgi:hypothetical protein
MTSELCQRTATSDARPSPYPIHLAQSSRPTESGLDPVTELQTLRIKKPAGEVNRPSRGGYNLQKALGWNAEQLAEVQV